MNVVLPAALESIATRADNTLKLTFGTPELNAVECGNLFKFRRKEVLLMISSGEINKAQLDVIDEAAKDLKEINKKSHSQRLREVLYILHEQQGSTYSFNDFYAQRMELLIEQIKDRLE